MNRTTVIKMTREKKTEVPNLLRWCGTTGNEYILRPTPGGSKKGRLGFEKSQ